jgi:hypothetical protein
MSRSFDHGVECVAGTAALIQIRILRQTRARKEQAASCAMPTAEASGDHDIQFQGSPGWKANIRLKSSLSSGCRSALDNAQSWARLWLMSALVALRLLGS